MAFDDIVKEVNYWQEMNTQNKSNKIRNSNGLSKELYRKYKEVKAKARNFHALVRKGYFLKAPLFENYDNDKLFDKYVEELI
jgi:hypothetical protein